MPHKLSEVALILVGSTLIILILISLVITSLFIHQKRKFRHSNELVNLKNTYERELLKAQLEIQWQTFEDISRELHDNVGTIISIALVHIKSLGFGGKSVSLKEQKIVEVDALLNEAMDALRDISKSIKPENIIEIGWLKSFELELEKVRKTKMFTVKFSAAGAPFQIEETKQVILFRILQEALNNAIKHSNASTIQAIIEWTEAKLEITLEDDGNGFDEQSPSEGSGLKNMNARAAMLPASIKINTSPNGGTVIHISYIREENALL
jgi:two-component system, NarL family, sensor kinase